MRVEGMEVGHLHVEKVFAKFCVWKNGTFKELEVGR